MYGLKEAAVEGERAIYQASEDEPQDSGGAVIGSKLQILPKPQRGGCDSSTSHCGKIAGNPLESHPRPA